MRQQFWGLHWGTDSQSRKRLEALAPPRRRSAAGLTAHETQEADRLPLIDQAERHRVLVEWDATEADIPQDKCVHELVEAQVARTPDAIAVVFDGERLTYAGNSTPEPIASPIISGLRGWMPAWRSAPGAASRWWLDFWVSLRPAAPMCLWTRATRPSGWPPMLKDSAPIAVLTRSPAQVSSREAWRRWVIGFRSWSWRRTRHGCRKPRPTSDPAEVGLTSRHLSHVIYTSGSHRPTQGRMNQHRGLVNRLAWGQRAYEIHADDRVLQKTPFSLMFRRGNSSGRCCPAPGW